MSEKRHRASTLKWIRIGDMDVSERAQREFKKEHAEALAAVFDLEAVGYPVVNFREGRYWILDGQHRIAALRLNGFDDSDLVQCECYEGYSEAEEAELFLKRDERRRVSVFDRFRIGLVANREPECNINEIVEDAGYRVSYSGQEGSIAAVEALRFGYGLGPDVLDRAVRILGTSYNADPAAFKAGLIRGMSLVCHRYNGALDDSRAVQRLSGLPGGTIALNRKAAALQLKTGHSKQHCIAAAIVDTLNGGRGGHKLETWWH